MDNRHFHTINAYLISAEAVLQKIYLPTSNNLSGNRQVYFLDYICFCLRYLNSHIDRYSHLTALCTSQADNLNTTCRYNHRNIHYIFSVADGAILRNTLPVIIPGTFEPSVRSLRATLPAHRSQIFR